MKKSNFTYLFVSSSNRPSEVMQASIRKLAASQPLYCRQDFFSPQSSLTSVCLATEKKIHGIFLYFSKRISYIKNLSGKYPPPSPRFALTIPVNILAKICHFFSLNLLVDIRPSFSQILSTLHHFFS